MQRSKNQLADFTSLTRKLADCGSRWSLACNLLREAEERGIVPNQFSLEPRLRFARFVCGLC